MERLDKKIVLCKDCKYFKKIWNMNENRELPHSYWHICLLDKGLPKGSVTRYSYCSYGEKK